MIPKINESQKYDATIPSTGKKIRYRPYLVKEQRTLLTAFESGDKMHGLKAVADTVAACILDDIDISKLTLYDIEYLYTMMRSRSVGETAKFNIKCSNLECAKDVMYTLKIDDIGVDNAEAKIKKIKFDNIVIEMGYPNYMSAIQNDMIIEKTSRTDRAIGLVAESIHAISTEDERVIAREEPREELLAFVESLLDYQFEELYDHVLNAPKLKYDIHFTCPHCNEKNEYTMRETKDFF